MEEIQAKAVRSPYIYETHKLTTKHRHGGDAGEGRQIDLHPPQNGREFHDALQPLAKLVAALLPVQHFRVVEHERVVVQVVSVHWKQFFIHRKFAFFNNRVNIQYNPSIYTFNTIHKNFIQYNLVIRATGL